MQRKYKPKDVHKILRNKGYKFDIFDVPSLCDKRQPYYYIQAIKFSNNIKALIPEHYYNKFNIYLYRNSITISKKHSCTSNEFWELLTYMAKELPYNPINSNKNHIDVSLACEWTKQNKSSELGLEFY